MKTTKPFEISKHDVLRAWELVKANDGAEGVDGETIEQFESDLKGNLYKLWNRMSSGSYFPQPTRTVEILKKDGGTRKLGIPTVLDRLITQAIQQIVGPIFDAGFSEHSYGFRPDLRYTPLSVIRLSGIHPWNTHCLATAFDLKRLLNIAIRMWPVDQTGSTAWLVKDTSEFYGSPSSA